jgi:2-dehydro-3-deoxyphosphogluconate aldolase/(4S)-4-hydroxy-2-oxoglutarate aldolase
MNPATATRTRTLESIRQARLVAVIRADTADLAVEAARQLFANGIRVLEVTYTVPEATRAVDALAPLKRDGLVLGAGTILTADDATAAIGAGAEFLVSPHHVPAVIETARAESALAMPGAFTPREAFEAWQSGGDVVKIFPAGGLGPSYFRALRGPYPTMPLMPTGGVTADNVHEWLAAGAVAVGVGGELLPADAIRKGDHAEIARRARRFLEAIAAFGA